MTVDVRAVGLGAGVALVIGVPMAVIAQAVIAVTDDTPGWVPALSAIILAGFVAGGFVAGSKRPDTPSLHGALAAVSAFLVVQLLGVVLIAARGDDLRPVAYGFNAFVAAACGTVGGLIADRRSVRARS
ncbi:MAG: TIGR04086 family membrane protein [Acidimicrobiales bacterium]